MLKFGKIEKFIHEVDKDTVIISFIDGIPYDIWKAVNEKYGNPLTAGGYFGMECYFDHTKNEEYSVQNGIFYEDYRGERMDFAYPFTDEEMTVHFLQLTNFDFSIVTNIVSPADKSLAGASKGKDVNITFSALDKDDNIVYSKLYSHIELADIGDYMQHFVNELPREITEPTNYAHVICLGNKSEKQFDELLEKSVEQKNNYKILTKNVILVYDSTLRAIENFLKDNNIEYSLDSKPSSWRQKENEKEFVD